MQHKLFGKNGGGLPHPCSVFRTPVDVRASLDEQGIRCVEVVEHRSHSGNCCCGAYADRWLELDAIHENWPDMWADLRSLEDRVIVSTPNGNMTKESHRTSFAGCTGRPPNAS